MIRNEQENESERSEANGEEDSNSDKLSDSEISEQQFILQNNIRVANDIPTSKSEAF